MNVLNDLVNELFLTALIILMAFCIVGLGFVLYMCVWELRNKGD